MKHRADPAPLQGRRIHLQYPFSYRRRRLPLEGVSFTHQRVGSTATQERATMNYPPRFITQDRISRAALIYTSDQYAAQAMGIAASSFADLCRKYGVETPNQRRKRNKATHDKEDVMFRKTLLVAIALAEDGSPSIGEEGAPRADEESDAGHSVARSHPPAGRESMGTSQGGGECALCGPMLTQSSTTWTRGRSDGVDYFE